MGRRGGAPGVGKQLPAAVESAILGGGAAALEGNVQMSDSHDDYRQLMEQKRFLGEIEQGIRIANREIIHQRIPSLSMEKILAFAVSIGRLRARYLEEAFRLGVADDGEPPNRAEIHELKTRREMFEEARHAFEALREAIEKGYVDIEGLASKKP